MRPIIRRMLQHTPSKMQVRLMKLNEYLEKKKKNRKEGKWHSNLDLKEKQKKCDCLAP